MTFWYDIEAGVQEGSILGPIVSLLYTTDFSKIDNNMIATFADDTDILMARNSH